ncbi:MAG: HmuY family protein [Myxococcaceae bacterium]|jgi:hypothetical protein|nr:HmuY family protein [Myxococcaceae bacterium]MCA3015122.1 HmuY family protein [Myxococcaceae bacterium]
MRLVTLFVVAAASACAPDLRVTDCFDGICGELPTEPLFSFTRAEGGLVTALVDATSKTLATYIDLDEPKELKFDEAEATGAWELSFMRDKIRSNGGGTNPAGTVEVAVLPKADFDALTQAPASGFQRDGAEGVFNTVDGGWYYYDLGVHRLTTLDHVYVVRTGKGAYFKVRLGSYYDENGTSARISVRFAPVAPP